MKKRAVLAIGLVLPLGCAALSDPAVSLAYCIETAVSERDDETVYASCNLEVTGSYVVVLHPEGEVSDEPLVSAGLPPRLVAELRALRIADRAAIYVIAADPAVTGTGTGRLVRSSRTTYQNNFVRIPRLMVAQRNTQAVDIEIFGPPGARAIQSIR